MEARKALFESRNVLSAKKTVLNTFLSIKNRKL